MKRKMSMFFLISTVCLLVGCNGIGGIEYYDSSNFEGGIINGGLGQSGWDYSYSWPETQTEIPPVNSLMIFIYQDETTISAGYGFVRQHSQGEYYVEVDYATELPVPGAYELSNYTIILFTSPFVHPPIQYKMLDNDEIEAISYHPDKENMIQFVWQPNTPTDVPFGSILEIEYYESGGRDFINSCHLGPLFSRGMCQIMGIGGIDDFDLLNKDNYKITLVKEGNW